MLEASALAQHGVFLPEVADIAFDALINAGHADAVAKNLTIPFAIAKKLAARKLKVAPARTLFAQGYSTDEALQLMAIETRLRVIKELLTSSVLDEHALRTLATHKAFSAELASTALEWQEVPTDLRSLYATTAGGQHLLDETIRAYDGTEAGKESLKHLLRSIDSVVAERAGGVTRVLGELVAAQPWLLELVDEDDALPARTRSAFAASTHLRSSAQQRKLAGIGTAGRSPDDVWPLLVLVGNPLTAEQVLKDLAADLATNPTGADKQGDLLANIQRRLSRKLFLEEGATIASAPKELLPWLLRRALPAEGYSWGRLPEMVALADNENLTARDAQLLTSGLQRFQDEQVAVDAINALASRFPSDVQPATLLTRSARELSRAADAHTSLAAHRARITEQALMAYDHWEVTGKETFAYRTHVLGAFSIAASHALGRDYQRWEALVSISAEFDGTLGELIQTASLL